MKKIIKVALLVQFGELLGYELPEGCPKEYKDMDKRHLLADWLEQNASNDGPFIVEKLKDGSVSYEYLSDRRIGDDELGNDIYDDALTRLIVTEVDTSRPWTIFGVYDGYEYGQWNRRESVYYLDNAVAQNQIIPDEAFIDSDDYRHHEEADRSHMILLGRYHDGTVSIVLSPKNVEGASDCLFHARTVKDAVRIFNQCAAWGRTVGTFVLDADFSTVEENGLPLKGNKILLWLEKRHAIDPDFKMPLKIKAITKDGFVVSGILREIYGAKNFRYGPGHNKLFAKWDGTPVPTDAEMDKVKRKFKEIAGETLQIIVKREYRIVWQTIALPWEKWYSTVRIFSPQDAKTDFSVDNIKYFLQEKMCRFTVTNEDSFRAASRFKEPTVLNFATAKYPCGGIMDGSSGQEELLCRCSTLFASLSSKEAAEMYEFNRDNPINTYSDYMLFSPYVVVFRDAEKGLLKKPFVVSVVSVPAPNRGEEARHEPEETIREVLLRRIRRILVCAMEYHHRNLVLGAWGCGALKNNPRQVASCFRQVLVDEKLGYCFDDVCFAVYGQPGNPNLVAFEEVFKDFL